MDLKRRAIEGALVPAKKARTEIVAVGKDNQAVIQHGIKRTSSLQAPIMLLSGHEGEIFTCKFSPDGSMIASAGNDRLIYLWNTYGDCENFHVMKGHTSAIVDLKYNTDGSEIVTASVDKTLALWDLHSGTRIKKLKGHQGFVNCCDVARRGPQLVCSGSDDGTIKIFDSRKRGVVTTLQNTYQVTAVAFSDTAEQVISGGIDNELKYWDLRKNSVQYTMRGHTDTVTGMALSGDGSYILTTAMDNTVRVWDIRPFAPQERCVKIMQGNHHSFEKYLLKVGWSSDGSKVTAGSSDRFVYIWDTTSRRVLYKLPGHKGSVNEVCFHPTEPIIMSCSSDKQIYLGEIEN